MAACARKVGGSRPFVRVWYPCLPSCVHVRAPPICWPRRACDAVPPPWLRHRGLRGDPTPAAEASVTDRRAPRGGRREPPGGRRRGGVAAAGGGAPYRRRRVHALPAARDRRRAAVGRRRGAAAAGCVWVACACASSKGLARRGWCTRPAGGTHVVGVGSLAGAGRPDGCRGWGGLHPRAGAPCAMAPLRAAAAVVATATHGSPGSRTANRPTRTGVARVHVPYTPLWRCVSGAAGGLPPAATAAAAAGGWRCGWLPLPLYCVSAAPPLALGVARTAAAAPSGSEPGRRVVGASPPRPHADAVCLGGASGTPMRRGGRPHRLASRGGVDGVAARDP